MFSILAHQSDNINMNEFNAVLLAIVAMLFWGIEEFFLKEAISKIKTITTLLLNTVTSILVSTIMIVYVFDQQLSLISLNNFIFTIIVAVVTFIGFILL
jgi:drug/metabolite transporter (DMT)-like permease